LTHAYPEEKPLVSWAGVSSLNAYTDFVNISKMGFFGEVLSNQLTGLGIHADEPEPRADVARGGLFILCN
jgi:hypothetical protein